jgi:hypothetical protein
MITEKINVILVPFKEINRTFSRVFKSVLFVRRWNLVMVRIISLPIACSLGATKHL